MNLFNLCGVLPLYALGQYIQTYCTLSPPPAETKLAEKERVESLQRPEDLPELRNVVSAR